MTNRQLQEADANANGIPQYGLINASGVTIFSFGINTAGHYVVNQHNPQTGEYESSPLEIARNGVGLSSIAFPNQSLFFDTKADLNTLVNGDLSHLAWVIQVPTPPSTQAFAGDSTITGLRSLVYVNSDGYCAPNGYLERPFTVPAGVTGIKLQLDEVQQSAVGATGDFALQLYDTTGITQISTTSFTPGVSATNVTSAEITVTPGIEYKVRVNCNLAGTQSRFLAGKFRVFPSTTSGAGIFGASFKRFEVYGALQDNENTIWYNPRWCPQNEFSYIELKTDSSFVIETFNNSWNYLDFGNGRAALTPLVDGFPLDQPKNYAAEGVSFFTENLPTTTSISSNPRTVRIQAGMSAANAYPSPVVEERGSWLCAIYVPATAYANLTLAPLRTIVLYGDSKESGSYSNSPGRDSITPLLRAINWKVVSESTGGGALAFQVSTTIITVAVCRVFALKLSKSKPDNVVLAIGRNDWVGGTFSPANLVTQLGNLADAIHEVMPACNVIFTSWTSEGTETAVSGVSWDTERTNILTLCQSRAPWCTYIDEARYWTPAEQATYTVDTVHPNSLGYERKLRGLVTTLSEQKIHWPWSPLQLTPTIWVEGRAGLVGGAMGAVTATGTAHPTVTLSGTAAIACSLRIEVTTSAAMGTAVFRWSVDGGRSWVGQNILTAATVALPGLGVTVNFASGNYFNDNVYTATSTVTGWNDLSGNGNNFALTSTAQGFLFQNEPALNVLNGGYLKKSGLSYNGVYTLFIVANRTGADTALNDMLGEAGALQIYRTAANTYAINDGVGQISFGSGLSTPNVNHIYAVQGNNGASSFVRLDGVQTAGTLSTNYNFTELRLGYGQQAVNFTGNILAFVFVPRLMTSSEILNVEARFAAMYQTPTVTTTPGVLAQLAGTAGTVVANGTTGVDVTFPNIKSTSQVLLSMNTKGGTPSAMPLITITAGVKFTVTSYASDTSTYNYIVIL